MSFLKFIRTQKKSRKIIGKLSKNSLREREHPEIEIKDLIYNMDQAK